MLKIGGDKLPGHLNGQDQGAAIQSPYLMEIHGVQQIQVTAVKYVRISVYCKFHISVKNKPYFHLPVGVWSPGKKAYQYGAEGVDLGVCDQFKFFIHFRHCFLMISYFLF